LHKERILPGSLVTMARTCGKAKCKCQKGAKHVSLYLAVRVGESRKMIYVPRELEQAARAWVAAYQRARRLTDQVAQASLKRFLQAKQAIQDARPGPDRSAAEARPS
jgi:hypothetical protein